MRARGFLELIFIVAVISLAVFAVRHITSQIPDTDGRRPDSQFVSVEGCAVCHEEEYRHWRGSHHDLAMRVATPETVLGDFLDDVFDHHGTKFRFQHRDGEFWVTTAGPDGRPTDYKVEYTFGVEPLQQYLVSIGGGRLQALTVCWDTKQERWFALHDERIPWGGVRE